MNKGIEVSIILPSLNVEPYIRECLNSVCRQSLTQIEIICVDAGSTDGTQEIIRQYQKRDERILLISVQKKSYGYQVNVGIKQARGKYIAIVDTDDAVEPNMYEKLLQIAQAQDLDFIKTDYYQYSPQNDQQVQKTVCRIVCDENDYNRVINPAEHFDIFRQLYPATWSGIYRKQFLMENNICHNETPGASYQDTGFWILTYLYARRAYFLNTPFYMYRINNVNSSVYDGTKTYCIRDEWRFVLQKLEKCEKAERYNAPVSYIFFRKYKRNLERILPESREEFLHYFSEDFRKWEKEMHLSYDMFSEDEKNEMKSIICNPIKYYNDLKKRTAQFLSELESFPELIIYGTGKVGNEILSGLKKGDNLICIAVSQKNNREETRYGLTCRCISDLVEYRKSAYVVLAVMTEEYRRQMENTLQELGFEHVIRIPHGLFQY